MKKLLLIAIAFCTFTACDDDDNSELWDEVKNQGNKIEMLESEMEALKLKIEGLNQTFKAITEMINGGLITNVEEVTDPSTGKTGFTFTVQTYSEASGTQINTYTIWNGTDGKDGNDGSDGKDGENGSDGADGAPGSTPQIGVEKEEATGLYYWTLNGEPMKDADGKLIYTSKAPQLRINNESGSSKWEISYDDGATWTELGVFTGSVASSSITVELDATGSNVIIKQEGKPDITFPIVEANNLGITFTNVPETGLSVMAGGVYLVGYELKSTVSANATVKVEMLNGTNFEVENVPGEKKFKVTAKSQDVSDVVLVHVYDSVMCMHTSFNITSTSAITEPKVVLPLEADEVTHSVQLTLPEAMTGDITITSLGGTLPAGAVTIPSTVTVNNGQGSFDVVVKRTSLTAGTAYTLQLVFSKEDAGYPVLGSMEMLTGTFTKITLSGNNYILHNIASGSGDLLCDNDESNFWESKYQSNIEMYGDPTYGVYIDVVLPYDIVAVQFKYSASGSAPKQLAIGAENGVWTLLGTQAHNQPAGKWPETFGHAMPDNSAFSKVRFGITQGHCSSITPSFAPTDGSMTGYLGGGRNSGNNSAVNYVRVYELQVFGLSY